MVIKPLIKPPFGGPSPNYLRPRLDLRHHGACRQLPNADGLEHFARDGVLVMNFSGEATGKSTRHGESKRGVC